MTLETHYSVAQVAERLNVSKSLVRKWLFDECLLEYCRIGSKVLIPESSLSALLKESKVKTVSDMVDESLG